MNMIYAAVDLDGDIVEIFHNQIEANFWLQLPVGDDRLTETHIVSLHAGQIAVKPW